MIAVSNIGGNVYDHKRSFLIYSDGSKADIEQGELVEEGIADASLGAISDIQTPNLPVNVVGLLMQLYDGSEVGEWTFEGTLTTESNRPLADVDIRPFAVFRAEIAITTAVITVTAGAGSSTTEVGLGTTFGAADVCGGSWFYNSTDNEIRFMENQDAATTGTFNTDVVAAWASGDVFYICPQRLYGSKTNQGMTVSGTKIFVKGDETAGWAKVLDHFISYDGHNEQVRLNPGIHDAQTYTNLKLWIDIIVLDHAFNDL